MKDQSDKKDIGEAYRKQSKGKDAKSKPVDKKASSFGTKSAPTKGKGEIGESYRAQQKAPGSSKRSIGGIESGMDGKKPMGLSVTKNGSAYANQEKAMGGLHGTSTQSSGSIMPTAGVPYGKANANQAHWKDGGSKADISHTTKDLSGETGSYMGHFRQEKFIRQGHNSDGMIPMAPSGGPQPDTNGGAIADAVKKLTGAAQNQTLDQNVSEGKEAQTNLDDLDKPDRGTNGGTIY